MYTFLGDVKISSVRLGSKNPRSQEARLFRQGYLRLPEDLSMMGCDPGTYVWVKYRDDTTAHEEEIIERIARLQNRSFRPSVTTKRILTERGQDKEHITTDQKNTTNKTDSKQESKQEKDPTTTSNENDPNKNDNKEEEEDEDEELPLTASSVRLWAMVDELALDDIEVAQFKNLFDEVDQFNNGYLDLEDMVRWAGFSVEDFPALLSYFVAMACPNTEDNLGRPLSESVPGQGGFFIGRSRLRRLSDPLRFGDFLRILGVFCLMDTKHFVRMTFNFGDRERVGSIVKDDVFRVLFAVWPVACSGDRMTLKLAMEKYMRRNNVGTRSEPFVSYKHWREMCKRFPRLVLPLKKLQYSWSVLFMGVKWWNKKKLGLQKARKKIIKDMGLAARKKLINDEKNKDDLSTDEDDDEM